MSPLLFIIFFSDVIAEAFPRDPRSHFFPHRFSAVDVAIYADDLVFVASCAAAAQDRLDRLFEYCSENALTVNATKTEIIYIPCSRQRALPILTYAGTPLKYVPEFKHLGFWITPHLKGKIHIRKALVKSKGAAVALLQFAKKLDFCIHHLCPRNNTALNSCLIALNCSHLIP